MSKKSKKDKKRAKRWASYPLIYQARCLVGAVGPLLTLFSELDDVFTEDEALSPQYRQVSLGRCYEAWQRCRVSFDSSFVAAEHRRPRRRGIHVQASDRDSG